MPRTRFKDADCPIARATNLMGDSWTPIVMREAFRGRRRFDEFQEALSMSRSVLSKRLSRLVEAGLLEKRAYEDRPPRFEYILTRKGRAFYPVLAAMLRFGEDWLWDEGSEPPLQLLDRETGEPVVPLVVNEKTGEPIDVRKIRLGRRRKEMT
jgi:DNA-binding HxlR family transcriptional regulator